MFSLLCATPGAVPTPPPPSSSKDQTSSKNQDLDEELSYLLTYNFIVPLLLPYLKPLYISSLSLSCRSISSQISFLPPKIFKAIALDQVSFFLALPKKNGLVPSLLRRGSSSNSNFSSDDPITPVVLQRVTNTPFPDPDQLPYTLQTIAQVSSLQCTFLNLKHPGCGYQKYLRWAQGGTLSQPIYQHVVVALAMLPPTIHDCLSFATGTPDTYEFSHKTKQVLKFLFFHSTSLTPQSSSFETAEQRLALLDEMFNPTVYIQLLSWLADAKPDAKADADDADEDTDYDPSSESRVRILFAEYHQIACRDPQSSLIHETYPSELLGPVDESKELRCERRMSQWDRCLGAFQQLLLIRAGATDEIRFWA